MTENKLRQVTDECWSCKHKRSLDWNTHIRCSKPDRWMTGSRHGIVNGWFTYPIEFDPVWKTKLCSNYEYEDVS